ncbi:ribosomal protein S10 [Verruconis gallopava]|uniref:Small ribosomal subunit protein uS10m n=1 Tax=Verruconis gallopava TaxID=253628 RepID=A0A0D2BD69_9PEZI|nr:ribosomal protein S10 [Verruconis gallopava]KIW09389.1 ribosomal protein S10 [Verruconis gallopava]
MSNPAYWRPPLSAAKRLKVNPSSIQRPSYVCHQRAGLADAGNLSNQTSAATDELVNKQQSAEVAPSQPADRSLKHASMSKSQASQPPGFEHLGKLDPRTREFVYNMNLPPNVRSVYLRPLRRAPTHGIAVCDLQMRSYSVRNLEFFADFAMRAAYYLGLPAKGPVPLPQITERWTVPRGPFVHKKSQENFERKTLRRLIQIQDGHPEVVQAWLAYLEKRAYYGIGMKANVYEWESFDVTKKLDEDAKTIAEQAEETFANFGVRQAALERLEETLGDEPLQELLSPSDDVRREPKEISRSS